MRSRILLASWFMVTGLALGTTALSAPSLPIIRPPVSGPDTGPAADTNSTHGQWFSDINTNRFEVRTHEFHDNTLAQSGGTNEHLAIAGYITDIQYGDPVLPFNPKGPITGFSITAIVSNDTPSVQTNWPAGINNSHNEELSTTNQWDGTLYSVVLTAEFARNNKAMEPEGGLTLPYKPDGNTENAGGVIATNEDLWAWYCWAPSSAQDPKGGWFVPAWNFGDIPKGQGATRVLNFSFTNPLQPGPLYTSLETWQTDGTDVLGNRSYSVKIKSWVSSLLTDSELDNLLEPESDVSVFHNVVPPFLIANIRWDKDLAKADVSSLGRIGIGTQILQSCSDLVTSNWTDLVTNPVPLPAPYTNLWEDLQTAGTSTFYRIIQQ